MEKVGELDDPRLGALATGCIMAPSAQMRHGEWVWFCFALFLEARKWVLFWDLLGIPFEHLCSTGKWSDGPWGEVRAGEVNLGSSGNRGCIKLWVRPLKRE